MLKKKRIKRDKSLNVPMDLFEVDILAQVLFLNDRVLA